MIVAVEGCCHGELDIIYETILKHERDNNVKVDLLLCCGDFQAIRNEIDLEDLSCPPKYKKYRNFKSYYNCEKIAPVLTIFIGGNHESIDLLRNLYYGGWVAPNIYYMGHSGVVNFGGLRIAGISGIYNFHNYTRGYFESPPYNEDTRRSAYHIREFDVEKLYLIDVPIDIFLSHDWPAGIENYGNIEELLRIKPYFARDIHENTLGNPKTVKLLEKLKPRYWFSAHLHVKYEAEYRHADTVTQFLALDKVLPRRKFLEVIKIKECQCCNEEDDNIDDHDDNSTEVQSYSSSTSTRGYIPAVSCSNLLPVNGNATPGDRGDVEGSGWTSSGVPGSDLRELEGEVNRRADGRNVTSSGEADLRTTSGGMQDDGKMNFSLCYDMEWCSILVANKDKMALNTFPSSNPLSLSKPTQEDYEYVVRRFESSGYPKAEIKCINRKDKLFCIPKWSNDFKNVENQRNSFMELLELPDNNYFTPNKNTKFTVILRD